MFIRYFHPKKIFIFIFCLWLFGLLLFIKTILYNDENPNKQTDAIIVLTGGKNRVVTGLQLLKEGKAKKLLISGVNEKSSMADLKYLYDKSITEKFKLYEDRIILGQYAKNTQTNALEASVWMELENYKSLRLVTSYYHIPRSLIEFKLVMPNVEIITHRVFSDNDEQNNWWFSPYSLKLIVSEYNKFIIKKALYLFN